MSVIHPFVSSEMKWTVQQSWKPPWDCSCWFNVSCVHRGVTKGAQFPRRRKVLAISQVLSSTAELLPKDFRFEHVGAKLICCPGRHLTLLRPWSWPFHLCRGRIVVYESKNIGVSWWTMPGFSGTTEKHLESMIRSCRNCCAKNAKKKKLFSCVSFKT